MRGQLPFGISLSPLSYPTSGDNLRWKRYDYAGQRYSVNTRINSALPVFRLGSGWTGLVGSGTVTRICYVTG